VATFAILSGGHICDVPRTPAPRVTGTQNAQRHSNSAPRQSNLRQHPSDGDLTREGAPQGWRGYLKAMGPGLVTGASDDDPSGVATYSQAGAQFGLGLLWVSLLTLPLMAGVQEICDRTALATGRGLGELASEKFKTRTRPVLVVLLSALIVANALNISADLVAVGSGMNLLHAGPTWVWALIAGAVITALIIMGSFTEIARVFKIVCLALLTYFIVLFSIKVNWGQVGLHTVVPRITLNSSYFALLVAVLGTTISPYLFFWQSAHRLEELREEPEGGDQPVPLKNRTKEGAKYKSRTARGDVFTGMAFSNAVMFAIIVVTATTLHGKTISSAADAANALKPVAGHWSSVLFALGFIGTGMLAIPVLAGSGAAGMAGLLGKRWGFSRSVRKAPVFYGLVAVGTVGGTILSLLSSNPIHLLVLVAVINGIAAAPFLLVVMLIARDSTVMGEFRNGKVASTLGWLAFGLMAAAALVMLSQYLHL
jgi:NRAMP (natural resistance-associated macrophage protein)-like metal ion transporter